MSEIVDMLRLSADDMERNPGVAQRFSPQFLRGLACRIDAEMAELPRGKDGKPIRVGETVYGEDGKAWCVRGVTIGEITWTSRYSRYVIRVTNDTNEWRQLKPEWLTHERPDSLERITQELEDMSEHFRATDKESFSALLDFADRIRRLAEREDANGTE